MMLNNLRWHRRACGRDSRWIRIFHFRDKNPSCLSRPQVFPLLLLNPYQVPFHCQIFSVCTVNGSLDQIVVLRT